MKTTEKSPAEKITEAAKMIITTEPVEPSLQALLDKTVRWLCDAIVAPESHTSLHEARDTILFVAKASPMLAKPEWDERRRQLVRAAELLPDIGASLGTALRAYDAMVSLHEILLGKRNGGDWINPTLNQVRYLQDEVARLMAIIDSVSDTASILGKGAKLVALPGITLSGGKTLVPVDAKLRIGVVFAGGWHACSGPLAKALNLESWATQDGEARLMEVVAQRIEALWLSGNATIRTDFREEDAE